MEPDELIVREDDGSLSVEALRALFAGHYGPDTVRDEYLAWIHTGRATREFAPVVALRQEANGSHKLVGYRGALCWPLRRDGRNIRSVQLAGTLIAAEVRRRGLFHAMNVAFLDALARCGRDLVFNVSVDASRRGYERQGWSYLSGFRRHILAAPPALRRFARPADTDAAPGPPPWERVEHLATAREAACAGRWHTAYDASFFAWRWSRVQPAYRFLECDAGLVVYRLRRRKGLTELELGDLWPREWTLSCVRSLVARARAASPTHIVTIVLTHAHPLRPLIQRCGFLPLMHRELNLGVRPLSGRPLDTLDPTAWAVATGDLDTF